MNSKSLNSSEELLSKQISSQKHKIHRIIRINLPPKIRTNAITN